MENKKKIRNSSMHKNLTKNKAGISKIKKDIENKYFFILRDGKKIKNIKELAEEMGKMEDAVFFHHVNDERNDFSNWIRDVFDETELAEQIRHLKNKQEIQKKIYEYIIKELW
ncbi:MAG: DUF5752 family protein [Candidatus Woesearchaeota archaeon]